jgi:hypothetical protein
MSRRRLSSFLRSGPEDQCTYLTWQLRPCPGGSMVHLQVDQAECADTEEEAENTWLPVLANAAFPGRAVTTIDISYSNIVA